MGGVPGSRGRHHVRDREDRNVRHTTRSRDCRVKGNLADHLERGGIQRSISGAAGHAGLTHLPAGVHQQHRLDGTAKTLITQRRGIRLLQELAHEHSIGPPDACRMGNRDTEEFVDFPLRLLPLRGTPAGTAFLRFRCACNRVHDLRPPAPVGEPSGLKGRVGRAWS